MTWPIMVLSGEPVNMRTVTVVSTTPLVLIVGVADPGTSQSANSWKIWKETYDANGILVLVQFMNKSVRRDQIYANIQASGTTFS